MHYERFQIIQIIFLTNWENNNKLFPKQNNPSSSEPIQFSSIIYQKEQHTGLFKKGLKAFPLQACFTVEFLSHGHQGNQGITQPPVPVFIICITFNHFLSLHHS